MRKLLGFLPAFGLAMGLSQVANTAEVTRVASSCPFIKILVMPGLPQHEPHKSQSIELLKKAGIDATTSFRSMLQDIVQKLELNHNYPKSDLLEVLRVLKTTT